MQCLICKIHTLQSSLESATTRSQISVFKKALVVSIKELCVLKSWSLKRSRVCSGEHFDIGKKLRQTNMKEQRLTHVIRRNAFNRALDDFQRFQKRYYQSCLLKGTDDEETLILKAKMEHYKNLKAQRLRRLNEGLRKEIT